MAVFTVAIFGLISAVFAAPRSLSPTAQRIVGGSSTVIQQYPYIGSLQQLDYFDLVWEHQCGGSLITPRTILSAAHCFYDVNNPALWRVRLGSTFRSSGGQIHQASQLILHEDYDEDTVVNDIAILKMATSAILSPSVQVVSIPPPEYSISDNQQVTAIGWGLMDEDDEFFPEQLQHVDINVINQQLCYDRYIYLSTLDEGYYEIDDGMLCVGILNIGGKDTCQGDSGGPVSLKTADGHVVIGVTSWGYGCAHEFFPGVTARTSYFYNWIYRHGF